ncbi:MAG TPA: diguanylate cyclase [Solirubrobacterales bacterium]|nr:diguanylate cyclase [Solirubrobacterales bacterium]
MTREQATSDADQTLSEADQTSSDVDQDLSDRDQAAALTDQQISDREQASADRRLRATPPSERTAQLLEYERAQVERSEGTISRTANAVVRQLTSTERDEQARKRDENAQERDRISVERDAACEQADQEAADLASRADESSQAAQAALTAAASARDLAMRARIKAASDRERAAQDREAAAKDREQLRREMERSQLDEVTGAYQRGMGEILLRHEMSRAARTRRPMTLVSVEVNGMPEPGFDSGHDGALQTVFSALQSALRPFDPIVRWDGDRLVCVASGISPAEAEAQMNGNGARLKPLDPRAIVSFGFTALEPGDTLADLVARASNGQQHA